MTREETIVILKILKTSYPNFYKDMSKEDMMNTIALWSEMFENDDISLVKVSVKELVQKNKFPPSIADIKQEMYKLTNEETLPTELWAKLKKAISNGYYHSVEEFEKLPDECKQFIKTPNQLRELAQNDSEINNTVVKGQFLKQIENIQKRNKEEKQMLPEARKFRELALNIGQDVNKLIGGKENEK